MASIDLLSPEILHHIFLLGAQSSNNPRFILGISHVYSLWRGLAVSSSDLWAYVIFKAHFDLEPRPWAEERRRALLEASSWDKSRPRDPRFEHYLKLSKTRPLDVKVILSMPQAEARKEETVAKYDIAYGDQIYKISNALQACDRRHLARIDTLTVSSDSYVGFSTFFGELERRLDLQECRCFKRLEIEWTGLMADAAKFFWPLQTLHAISFLDKRPPHDLFPNLRCLSLRGVSANWENFEPRNLEELSISNLHEDYRPSITDLKSILGASQETLRRMTLLTVGRRQDGTSTEWGSLLTLPNVHTLELGYEDPQELFALVCSILLPGLRNLTVRNTKGKRDRISDPGDTAYFLRTSQLFESLVAIWGLSRIESVKLVDVQCMEDDVGYKHRLG
ncbi:hypothetical protein BDN72DRAFT_862588 [Pluteus cervinus]|uniref:Uncharacterized protein n=1 Tax=Pluteus cervinus TaxID=181527 RepID=A0ACD3ABK1_9AGAR|nr:hypothetical protein BDN72DRAFT_862588 [Pluteus cervinus]